MWFRQRKQRPANVAAPELKDESSILSRVEIQRSLANGAPPVPWPLRKQDREAVELLATYFAKAIPVPTDDGRVRVRETAGHGGPQLELYVPVLSSKTPVAVLVRNWHMETLESDLFFFGATDGRLAAVISKLGFVRRNEPENSQVTVFRNSREVPHQRAG